MLEAIRKYMRGGHYTLEEAFDAILAVEKKNSELVSIKEFGKSIEGRPLYEVRIARPDSVERAQVLITANIHADEFMGNRMALAIMDRLIEGYSKDPWIKGMLDRMDFYVLPLLNPDGYDVASRHMEWGFTTKRKNSRGVDLNRNFPYPEGAKPKGFLGGSKSKFSFNTMGPHPLSEAEAIAFDEYVGQHKFFVAINLHTTGGHFNYPWAFKQEPCPHDDMFMAMGRTLNEHQTKSKYKLHRAYDWYQTVGNMNDYLYGKFGTLSATVEIAKPDLRLLNPVRALNKFWWFNAINIQEWIDNDRDASLHTIETAYELTEGHPLPPAPIKWIIR